MKERKLSLSLCFIVSRLDEGRLCLWPPMKLLKNNLLNSSKELTVFGGILLNHTRASPLRVVGKALHIISFGTPWRCIVVLKVTMWSHGSCVPSYESNEGTLNLKGRGWLLMEVMKGELVRWHGPPYLIHLIFQMWHPTQGCALWIILMLNIFSFSNFLTLSLPFHTPFMTLSSLVDLPSQHLILTD